MFSKSFLAIINRCTYRWENYFPIQLKATLIECKEDVVIFFLIGHSWPFFIYFQSFQTKNTICYDKLMWKNVHPVSGTVIQAHNLLNTRRLLTWVFYLIITTRNPSIICRNIFFKTITLWFTLEIIQSCKCCFTVTSIWCYYQVSRISITRDSTCLQIICINYFILVICFTWADIVCNVCRWILTVCSTLMSCTNER